MKNAATRISVAIATAALGLGLAATGASAGDGEGGTQKAKVVAENGQSAAQSVASTAGDPTTVQLTNSAYGK
jgi:F0F1-type ATP synthase membrane subunit c/vacuolar-type H+-ATPase subunit K